MGVTFILFIVSPFIFQSCSKESGKGLDESTLTSDYTSKHKDVIIGQSFSLHTLLKDIPENAELSYMLRGDTQDGKIYLDNTSKLVSGADTKPTSDITVSVIQKATSIYKAKQINIKIRFKIGFSLTVSTPIFLVKSITSKVEVSIPKKLSGIDRNELSYTIKSGQNTTGIGVNSFGLFYAESNAQRGKVVVVVSQAESETHVQGSLEVEVEVREYISFSYDLSALKDGMFLESSENKGSIDPDAKVTVKLSGATFSKLNDGEESFNNAHYSVNQHIPDHLHLAVMRVDSMTAVIRFEGVAQDHGVENSPQQLFEFEWDSKAIEGEPSLKDNNTKKTSFVLKFI